MKITWNENPMATIVELDDAEKVLFKLKLKLEIYEDRMFNAHWAITERLKNMGSLKALSADEAMKEARSELDPKNWCTDDVSPIDKRVNELFEYYMADLAGQHDGDCTCVACSCSKCYAESLLGINTIKGLGKHPGHKVSSVFSQWNQETKRHDRPPVTLDEAIAKLRSYDKKPSGDAGAAALAWLEAYKAEHFPDHQGVAGDIE